MKTNLALLSWEIEVHYSNFLIFKLVLHIKKIIIPLCKNMCTCLCVVNYLDGIANEDRVMNELVMLFR